MVRYNTLSDIGEVNFAYLEKLTLKRYAKLRPILTKVVAKEASRFFLYVDEKAVGVHHNPFRLYHNKEWDPLTKEYVAMKRRKHRSTGFWSNRKILDRWFKRTNPLNVFGLPFIDIKHYNPMARGYQRMIIDINPFPRKNISIPVEIFNRLFGQRIVDSKTANLLGGIASNEELRPIIGPAMKQLINQSMKRKVTNTIKEVLLNG